MAVKGWLEVESSVFWPPAPKIEPIPTPMTVGTAINPAPMKISMNPVDTLLEGSLGLEALAFNFMNPIIPKTKPVRKATIPARLPRATSWVLILVETSLRFVACACAPPAIKASVMVAAALVMCVLIFTRSSSPAALSVVGCGTHQCVHSSFFASLA